ncbi:hypothetical protein PRZ48_009656 [Zasmidium cellare]|uniref:Uncharacterized protein n=1 Tax=Zasmidium cellare TaxID=395010 RepID=A0ABR0ECA4_ZASCE|nr:hypothetical protein PRZ48_009656 [Zasmidium cellare]
MSRILALPFQAWLNTSSMIKDFVEAEDPDERARRGEKWRLQKQEELKYVGITSALIAGTVSASFSWSNVERAPTITLACWYSALLMILISITTATQQHNTLQKIASRSDSALRLQDLLKRRSAPSKPATPDFMQHFIWQTPIMLLNIGIPLYIVGLLGLVFSQPLLGEFATQDTIAVKVVFAIAVASTIGSYLVAWLGVSSKLQSIETQAQSVKGGVC